MIISFKHKGLQSFFETGNVAKIQPHHSQKLRFVLSRLQDSHEIKDMNLPGLNLHSLSGNLKKFWAVSINGNWRLTFKFQDSDASFVDYMDYH